MPQNLMGQTFQRKNEEILSENPEFDAIHTSPLAFFTAR